MKTLQEGLKKWTKKNNIQSSPQKKQQQDKKPKQRKAEKFSEHDLKELMGTNMRTWKRGRGGSLRQ